MHFVVSFVPCNSAGIGLDVDTSCFEEVRVHSDRCQVSKSANQIGPSDITSITLNYCGDAENDSIISDTHSHTSSCMILRST
jgi:hypothetical protein